MIADKIDENLGTLRTMADDYSFLFTDAQQLVLKDNADLVLLINARIGHHKKVEEDRLESERARIRGEEAEKLRNEKPPEPTTTPAVTEVAAPASIPEPAGNESRRPVYAATPAAALSSQPDLRLGQIGDRLGFALTADFLRTLGFEPAGRDRAAVLYHQHDFDRICVALLSHIVKVRGLQQQAA